MPLPEFKATIGDDIHSSIMAELLTIEAEFDVRILFAIESGSRAWGFPSPDSDYDVRFVYAHPQDWYLSLKPGRDVIERPIDAELDIGGWDIRKALNLLLRPNPVLFEWMTSPIQYIWQAEDCTALLDLAARTAPMKACIHHYLHLGEGQQRRHLGDFEEVSYKKYFYVLRPALAIRWIRLNGNSAPPMNIQAMSNDLNMAPDVISEIDQLLQIKAKTRETGTGARLAAIDALIEAEFEWARQYKAPPERPDLTEDADLLFRSLIKRS